MSEEWSTVEVNSNEDESSKVEFEVEEQPEVKEEQPKELAPVVEQAEEQNEERPEELEGIQTKGAEKRIKQSIRHEDSLFRVGGEEFAVLLPETTLPLAQNLAERIRVSNVVPMASNRTAIELAVRIMGFSCSSS